MTKTISVKTPAKLNLMLHITGRREDGYHELQTVFQFIEWFDELSFTLREDNLIRRNDNLPTIAEKDDLMILAARLLQQKYGVKQGVEMSNHKLIPVGGGLGGGSSDAAATLMVLNRLWHLDLDEQNLQEIGRELGADIPIFIFGKSAWAEGVGEKLNAIDLPQPWYLVIHPDVFVSTAQIFASKNLTRDCHPITIRAFQQGEGSNVCEPVATKLYPQIQQSLDWLNQFSPARMTGTGACVFAAFDTKADADLALAQLPETWSGLVAKGMNTNPVTTACF